MQFRNGQPFLASPLQGLAIGASMVILVVFAVEAVAAVGAGLGAAIAAAPVLAPILMCATGAALGAAAGTRLASEGKKKLGAVIGGALGLCAGALPFLGGHLATWLNAEGWLSLSAAKASALPEGTIMLERFSESLVRDIPKMNFTHLVDFFVGAASLGSSLVAGCSIILGNPDEKKQNNYNSADYVYDVPDRGAKPAVSKLKSPSRDFNINPPCRGQADLKDTKKAAPPLNFG